MTYTKLPPVLFQRVYPTPVADPEIYCYNQSLSERLGLEPTIWRDPQLLSGNQLPEHFTPIAQAYLGHQFGFLARLGDGRAILLDEIITPKQARFDIQLKGAGRTAYSRGGDGRAALAPMLREYLISEAMHALGIPTTRSLAVVTTGEPVIRERALPGAILTRVARSHIRVGTFQLAQHEGVIQSLADYTIARHFPDCVESKQPYRCLLEQVMRRQARLIAQWQSVGFIHGVMNTDNMSIVGETIDYGPCGFMDYYRADQVFSSIDHQGRYRYRYQPMIAQWNLARLAESLISLIDPDPDQAISQLTEILEQFEPLYQAEWLEIFAQKLGLPPSSDSNQALIEQFLTLLEHEHLDFTNSFIGLTDNPEHLLFSGSEGQAWQKRWLEQIQADPDTAVERMRQSNPRVIPRNHTLDEALASAEAGDRQPFDQLLKIIQSPFALNVPTYYQDPPDPALHFVSYCGT